MDSAMKKAKDIRLLILDVDGILTNGLVYVIDERTDARGFHFHDGLGIKLLQSTGVAVAIISGKKSRSLIRRIKELKIKHYYLGKDEKVPAYEALKKELHVKDSDIAYAGDDLPDLPLLRRAGLAITVPNAPAIIKEHVDYTTKLKGGEGAVREICELIMQAQNTLQSVVESYLIK